jgi:RNA polymerase sigma-70 factor, ECF subfamily
MSAPLLCLPECATETCNAAEFYFQRYFFARSGQRPGRSKQPAAVANIHTVFAARVVNICTAAARRRYNRNRRGRSPYYRYLGIELVFTRDSISVASWAAAMKDASQHDITRLLQNWRQGDRSALGQLVPLIECDLRRIAKQRLWRTGHAADASLTITSLMQETYIRLMGDQNVDCRGRAHFFALCAEIIRGILVDHARARYAVKRGGGAPHISMDEALIPSEERAPNLVAIDDALRELAKVDPRKGRVIELRFFGGLTVEETADVLHISPDSVARDWRLAKMWLMRQIDGAAFHGAS